MISTSCELYPLMEIKKNKTKQITCIFPIEVIYNFIPGHFIYTLLCFLGKAISKYIYWIYVWFYLNILCGMFIFSKKFCIYFVSEYVRAHVSLLLCRGQRKMVGVVLSLHHVGHRGSNPGPQCWQQALLAIGPPLLFMLWDLSPPLLKKIQKK